MALFKKTYVNTDNALHLIVIVIIKIAVKAMAPFCMLAVYAGF